MPYTRNTCDPLSSNTLSLSQVDPDRPVLVDKYLDRADELDVDALCDKDGNVTICGIMQHIEQVRAQSGVQSYPLGFRRPITS